MSVSDLVVPEFDEEMASTRRLLQGLPEDKLVWKPHARSFSMGALAAHIVNIVQWMQEILRSPSFDISTLPVHGAVPTTRSELVSRFDANVEASRGLLARSDAEYAEPWSLKKGDAVLFTMPRYVCMRRFVLNHIIHHRAQLTVYLRENDVLVPGLYGPSADDVG